MHLATDLLATTELSVFMIARSVGYDAEEAFSRAFKREPWRLAEPLACGDATRNGVPVARLTSQRAAGRQAASSRRCAQAVCSS